MFGKKPVESPTPSPAVAAAAVAQRGGIIAGSISSHVAAPSVNGGIHADMERISYLDRNLETGEYREAKRLLIGELLDQLDFQALEQFAAEPKRLRVLEACDKVIPSILVPLTDQQIRLIKEQAINEILGFGPIEPLLADPDINDIMINTSKRVFVERFGKILLTDVQFNNEAHLIGVVQRIVSRVGRRIDEANPMVDARMPDGSRFNAIIPPLALDGCLVSIRKFKKNKLSLAAYIEHDSMNADMVKFLSICSAIRLNMVVSGGTGSGKTTLLNALSSHIDAGERIITIEDAAELKLDQPHVLRLETRPSSTEGKGEITQRALVKNALRMRPDRIILGEMRGEEVIDVLSAMNTGHDGSMATIHSNSPKDCLSRVENLVAMSSVNVGNSSLRYQIASAIQLIIQIQRMRDGKRRIVQIEEITGCVDGMITTQTLFSYRVHGMKADGTLSGEFVAHPIRPALLERAEYFGRTEDVLACFVSAK